MVGGWGGDRIESVSTGVPTVRSEGLGSPFSLTKRRRGPDMDSVGYTRGVVETQGSLYRRTSSGPGFHPLPRSRFVLSR